MALTKAQRGGDTDFDAIKKALLALGAKEVKAVFRTIELHDTVTLANGDVFPVTADMVVATGPNKGKVLRGYRWIWKGVTGPLRRAYAGGEVEVAAKLELKHTGATAWLAAQTPNDDDYEMIETFYGDGKSVWNGADLVEVEVAPVSKLAKAGESADTEPPF